MAAQGKKGISILGVLVLVLLALTAGFSYTCWSMEKERFSDEHPAYSRLAAQKLKEGSADYKLASLVIGKDRLEELRSAEKAYVTEETTLAEQMDAEINPDTNGDGVYIEHIYAPTYEGYMLVLKDASRLYVAVNPDMGSGREAPELEDYVERYHALAGINGGGFEDAGGTGNGSIPEGLVILDGRIVHGTAATRSSIVGITKDHKLVTTTTTGAGALAMGVQEAVTFGPTFITDGKVTYVPGTDNLNMLNPRTAVGMQKDGTMLLLVVDGRGPSSFGAKYEDIIEIFQKYDAVMAGNLDGGNSSVMIYNGRYVHYPVSMYDSRNLPSVLLVKEAE